MEEEGGSVVMEREVAVGVLMCLDFRVVCGFTLQRF